MLSIRQHKYAVLVVLVAGLATLLSPCRAQAYQTAADKSSAVIYAYQRIGEDQSPQTSLSLDTFRSHIGELKSSDYEVMPLPRIVEALRKNEPLPENTVGMTFDGLWLSTLNNAVPLLLEAQIPFTVFFSSDMADGGNPGHATWKQIRSLAKNKLVTLGIMPAGYVHMTNLSPEQNAALMNKAISRFRDETGSPPQMFAYPYGEISTEVKKQVSEYSFMAAFAQNSGVASSQSDMLALPRFTMTDAYGDLDRFMLTANALPLPVTDVTPEDNIIHDNPPVIGFTVTPEIKSLAGLSCFISGVGKIDLAKLPGNRIEIRPTAAFSDRTTRINCTILEPETTPGKAQRWRWLGIFLADVAYKEDDSAEPAESTE